MNKAELVSEVARVTGQNKVQVQGALSAFLHVLTGALSKGERVTLIGFGTFERRQRQARVGVNPQDPKQKLRIAAAKVPAFRAGQELKDVVDGKAKLHSPEMPAAPAKAKAKAKAKTSTNHAGHKKAAPKKKAKGRR
jgi:DNA-binding protein HU-beta